MFWKSYCPVCKIENNVYVYDRGFKFWRRFVVGNNRFACRNCKVSWRRGKPNSYVGFTARSQKGASGVTYTHAKRWPYATGINFLSTTRKTLWVYCVIGVLSVVVTYLIITGIPVDSIKLAPEQKPEILNNSANAGAAQGIRNDKMDGKQELLRLGHGKKSW